MSSISMAQSSATPETSRSGYFSRARTSSRPSAPRSVVSSAKTGAETKSMVSVHTEVNQQKDENPFKVPSDSQFFLLRDKERERKKAERERQKTLKVHEKMTYATKMNAQMANIRREIQTDTEDEGLTKDGLAVQGSPTWKLTITKDCHVEKESINDFINKKREMFHLQYALSVKREEMQKLETLAANEEYKLEQAEQFLEEDAAKFDEFLKENDQNSAQAQKIADTESKLKMEKVTESKRLTAQIVALKSDITRCEEIIKEYITYKHFLFKLSPKEWQKECKKKWLAARAAKQAAKEKEKRGKLTPEAKLPFQSPKRLTRQNTVQHLPSQEPTKENRTTPVSNVKTPTATKMRFLTLRSRRGRRPTLKSGFRKKKIYQTTAEPQMVAGGAQRKRSIAPLLVEEDNADESLSSDDEEESLLYFTDSRQLLDIFTELEQQNLSLIQNSQDTEETLEEIKQEFARTEGKMQKESQALKDQINFLKEAIAIEEEKAKDLKIKSQVFSFGHYQPEDQDRMLESLNGKVAEVYHACIGENQANHSTIEMLAIIESQLMDLLDNLERIPPEKMEMAEKAKEKERRLRLREVKKQQQKLHQEERLRRALERAQSDIKKTTGRKLMNRSDPPASKQKENKDQDKIDKEKEEINFFFS